MCKVARKKIIDLPDDLQAKFFKDFTKEIEEFSKRLDEFVPDEVADDYVKFIKENKEEILKSEDKFKVLVGDFDNISSSMGSKYIEKLYSFIQDDRVMLKSNLGKSARKIIIRDLVRDKTSDFLRGVTQKMIAHYLEWLLPEITDAKKNGRNINWGQYWNSTKVLDYIVSLLEAGVSSMYKFDEVESYQTFILKGVFDCAGTNTDWMKDFSSTDNLMIKIERNLAICTINEIVGTLGSSISSNYWLEVLTVFAQDELNDYIRNQFNDYYHIN